MLVLYRERSEYRQAVEDFIREFRAKHPNTRLEILDIDQREGIATASLYDIFRYPSFLALRDDGSVLQVWQGMDEMPRLDDVSYYTVEQL